MPNKKKKYNARFPPARIKKIMQTDEDVGKVAAAVPVIISRALELFIESLILKTSQTTQTRHAKTLTTAHIKQTIEAEKKFDFLRDLVVNITDHQPEEEPPLEGHNGPSTETTGHKKLGRPVGSGSRGPRKRKDSSHSSSEKNNIRRSKHKEEEEEEEEEEDNNNDEEETDDADSGEDDQEQQHPRHNMQDQNNQSEEETATTSSCLRSDDTDDDEESPPVVSSSNGFPPETTAPPPGYHSLGQPSSQFKVPPTLFSTTSLSKLLLNPGQTLGQQEEDDDYDT